MLYTQQIRPSNKEEAVILFLAHGSRSLVGGTMQKVYLVWADLSPGSKNEANSRMFTVLKESNKTMYASLIRGFETWDELQTKCGCPGWDVDEMSLHEAEKCLLPEMTNILCVLNTVCTNQKKEILQNATISNLELDLTPIKDALQIVESQNIIVEKSSEQRNSEGGLHENNNSGDNLRRSRVKSKSVGKILSSKETHFLQNPKEESNEENYSTMKKRSLEVIPKLDKDLSSCLKKEHIGRKSKEGHLSNPVEANIQQLNALEGLEVISLQKLVAEEVALAAQVNFEDNENVNFKPELGKGSLPTPNLANKGLATWKNFEEKLFDFDTSYEDSLIDESEIKADLDTSEHNSVPRNIGEESQLLTVEKTQECHPDEFDTDIDDLSFQERIHLKNLAIESHNDSDFEKQISPMLSDDEPLQ